jgi:3-deoxy-D-arabino-heptulosonate 7-phosphate (DAHP) synthase
MIVTAHRTGPAGLRLQGTLAGVKEGRSVTDSCLSWIQLDARI